MKFRVPKARFWPRASKGNPRGAGKAHGLPSAAVQWKFDEGTGQVYSESTLAIQGDEDRDWEYTRDASSSRPPSTANSLPVPDSPRMIGARSLVDQCIRRLLQYLDMLTLDGIRAIPERLAWQIWDECIKNDLVTFHVWKVFVTALDPKEASILDFFRYHRIIERPTSHLTTYTIPLTTQSFEFITSLSITTVVPIQDLVHLPSITNLGVLEIIHFSKSVRSPVSDRLIRAWHDSVLREGAFPVLRVLKLWNHIDITANSIEYINDFPALAVYDVRGCDFGAKGKVKARPLGWTPHLETNLVSLMEAACLERTVKMASSLDKPPKPLRRKSAEQLPERSFVSKISRKDVPEFLVTKAEPLARDSRPNPRDRFKTAIQNSSLSPEEVSTIATSSDSWVRLDNLLYERPRKLQTWDFTTTSVFTRVGELRNDADLKRAGVNIGEQAIVGDELINSVPLVCLRLGPNLPFLAPNFLNSGHSSLYGSIESDTTHLGTSKHLPSVRGNGEHLSFIRIKIPNPVTPKPNNGNAMITSGAIEPTKTSKKRNAPNMMKEAKKQDLGSVLGSFFR